MVPGPLAQLTGGYIYDTRMIAGLKYLGWQITVHEL
ncbi:MAG: glycosyltransferase family 1 protein, partial [Acidobacteriota bacterium]|nr:glycosyltransferase family 1 protein [Acidobacteriota bacterium]